MIFLIVSFSIFTVFLTILCFSGTVKSEIAKKQQLEWMGTGVRYIDDELEKSFYQRYIFPVWKKIFSSFARRPSKNKKGSEKINERNLQMENELRLAGIHLSVQEFIFLRLMVEAGLLAAGIAAALTLVNDIQLQLVILIFSLFSMVLIPRYLIKSRIKSRQLALQNQLPNVLDVLCVSIEAGLSFDSALLKVIERFKGPLIDEFSQVYHEIKMGKPRRDALVSLSQRSNVSELQTFISAVVQSEKFGTPMKNVLLAQAQQLRVSRRQHAQEKGMKAPVKMMLPMVVFIFPVMFIILLGPTLISVIKK